jgi:hypothetical protein
MHFSIPEDLAERIRKQAEAQGKSVSRFLADLVKRELSDVWPADYFETVLGGWEGAALVRADQGDFQE